MSSLNNGVTENSENLLKFVHEKYIIVALIINIHHTFNMFNAKYLMLTYCWRLLLEKKTNRMEEAVCE